MALWKLQNITIQESTEAVQMHQNPKLLEKQLISLQWFLTINAKPLSISICNL